MEQGYGQLKAHIHVAGRDNVFVYVSLQEKKTKHHIKSPASEHICASQASTRLGVRQFPSNRGTKLRKPTVILVK